MMECNCKGVYEIADSLLESTKLLTVATIWKYWAVFLIPKVWLLCRTSARSLKGWQASDQVLELLLIFFTELKIQLKFVRTHFYKYSTKKFCALWRKRGGHRWKTTLGTFDIYFQTDLLCTIRITWNKSNAWNRISAWLYWDCCKWFLNVVF